MTDSDALLAACWTWAGKAGPGSGTEHSPVPIAERVDAVAAAGWSGVGLSHTDVVDYGHQVGLPRLRRMLHSAGLQRIELEFLDGWWATGAEREASDQVRQDLLAAANDLEVDVIKIGAGPALDATTAEESEDFAQRFLEQFDRLATESGRAGVRVALEPIPPCWPLTIERAQRVVTEAANPWGGLCLDTYHLARSGTSAADLEADIAIDKVFMIELNDAPLTGNPPTVTGERGVPGTGELDVAAYVAALLRLGWAGVWGVEVISSDYRALPVAEATASCAASTRSVLQDARRRLRAASAVAQPTLNLPAKNR